jgi:hypothetical protein
MTHYESAKREGGGWMPSQLRLVRLGGSLFLSTSPFIELSGGGDFWVAKRIAEIKCARCKRFGLPKKRGFNADRCSRSLITNGAFAGTARQNALSPPCSDSTDARGIWLEHPRSG